jgi:hypothetical protein
MPTILDTALPLKFPQTHYTSYFHFHHNVMRRMAKPVEELSYRLGDTGFKSCRRHETFLFSNTTTPPLEPTQPPIQWLPGALCLGVKQLGHETEHATPSSLKFKNQWCHTSTLLHTLMASIGTSPFTCWRTTTYPCLRIIS